MYVKKCMNQISLFIYIIRILEQHISLNNIINLGFATLYQSLCEYIFDIFKYALMKYIILGIWYFVLFCIQTIYTLYGKN